MKINIEVVGEFYIFYFYNNITCVVLQPGTIVRG